MSSAFGVHCCSCSLVPFAQLQDPIDLRREAEAIYSAFELSLCRDVVFEVSTEVLQTVQADSTW